MPILLRPPTHRTSALALVIASLFLPGAALAQIPEAGHGSSATTPSAQENRSIARPVFQVHSGFWINLHHFLYQQARIRAEEPISRGAAPPIASAPPASVGSGTAAASADWTAALDYYAKHLANRDLLFDGDMVLLNNRLAELEPCPDLSGKENPRCAAGLQPELIAVLERAAPVYRAQWWPEHDRTNRAWIATVAPLVRDMGGKLSEQLTAVYHAEWPQEPIYVDVVSYAGPFGAYMSLEPAHISISSTDGRNQGLAGFEVLFHEASHALARAVQDGIARDCRARNIPIPRDLWHALLFYTTGELVKRALGKRDAVPASGSPSGPAAYEPYAYRNGLYARGWQDYERVLERYWQPYLDGRTDFDHALASLVSAL
jgi:hypothetical protein